METVILPPSQKRKVSRGPSYPGISLRDAISKTRIIWDEEKRHPVSPVLAAQHWDYSAKSSGGRIALAAFLKYGLLEEVNSPTGREVKITDRAMQICHGEEQPRLKAIQEAALSPKIYRELWERFGPELPSDDSLSRKLLLEWEFNQASIPGFIKDYRDAINFAGLKSGDKVDTPVNEDDDGGGEQGDLNLAASPETAATPPRQSIAPLAPPAATPSVAQVQKPSIPNNVLATFKIPLGVNEAELTFTGERLEPEDFDALTDYVAIFKKQYERKLKAEQAAAHEATVRALLD